MPSKLLFRKRHLEIHFIKTKLEIHKKRVFGNHTTRKDVARKKIMWIKTFNILVKGLIGTCLEKKELSRHGSTKYKRLALDKRNCLQKTINIRQCQVIRREVLYAAECQTMNRTAVKLELEGSEKEPQVRLEKTANTEYDTT